MRQVLFAAALLMTVTPSLAVTRHYRATLTGPSEVPANNTAGTGSVDAALDTVSLKLTYTVTWSKLTGPATMAHIHGPAPAGKNAGVLVVLGDNPTSPIHGSTTLTKAEVDELNAAQLYVNVHTAAHPKGEIRGQLVAAP
jgi:hypothetical protein